ncbi:unnamed protein product [Cochlearia groenlandica]
MVGLDKAERGSKVDIDEEECIKWLDSKEEGSMLYVCLGSICNLTLSHLKELGLGLKESQKPFIWVIRGITSSVPLLTWLLFGDQFRNEKLAVQLLKIVVRTGVEEPMRWGGE